MLLVELADPEHTAALLAPPAAARVTPSTADVAVSAREAGGALYLIAVHRSPRDAGTVRFSGLPAGLRDGTVLEHPGNPARPVAAARGAFTDPVPFGAHHARVYRFPPSTARMTGS